MNIRVKAASPLPVEQLLARLHDLDGWAAWLGPQVGFEVHRAGVSSEVQLDLRVPRPVRLRLEVLSQNDGIVVMLVEGELQGVEVEVQAVAVGEASELRAAVWVQFPVAVPGALLRELEHEAVPRWLNAIAADG